MGTDYERFLFPIFLYPVLYFEYDEYGGCKDKQRHIIMQVVRDELADALNDSLKKRLNELHDYFSSLISIVGGHSYITLAWLVRMS